MLPAAQRVWAKPLGQAAVHAIPVILVAGLDIRHPREVLSWQLGEFLTGGFSRGLEMRSDHQQLQALDDGPD